MFVDVGQVYVTKMLIDKGYGHFNMFERHPEQTLLDIRVHLPEDPAQTQCLAFFRFTIAGRSEASFNASSGYVKGVSLKKFFPGIPVNLSTSHDAIIEQAKQLVKTFSEWTCGTVASLV